jgi:hypothetical protein
MHDWSSRPVSRAWTIVACVVMALPLCLSVRADPDLWWHILAGRAIVASGTVPSVDSWSYTFAGAAWTNHEWLADVLLASSWDHLGTLGLLLVRGLCLVVFVGCMALAMWGRWPHPVAVVLLVGLPLSLNAALLNLRPQALSYVLVAVVLALLEPLRRGRQWPLWVLPGLFMLWANLHAGFAFGLLLAGVGPVSIARGWELAPAHCAAAQRRSLFALLCSIAAVCITPHGVRLLRYIVTELGAAHPYLPEWNPPDGAMVPIVALTVALALGLGLAAGERLRPTEWIGLGVAFVLTLRNQKFIILVLMLSSLCVASSLSALSRRHAQRLAGWAQHSRGPLGTLLFALAIVVGANAPWGLAGRIPVDSHSYPSGALAWLRASRGTGRLWCPLGWGGYALYHLHARYRVAIDGRNTTLYPVSFVVEQTEALYSGQLAPILALSPDLILTYGTGPLFDALERSGRYARLYRDAASAVFVRRGADFTPAPHELPVRADFPG